MSSNMSLQLSPDLTKDTNEIGLILEAREIVRAIKSFTLEKCPEVDQILQFYRSRTPTNITNRDVLTELCWIGYSSGFRFDIISKYWGAIREAFYGFDVMKVALLANDLEKQALRVCNETGFRNFRKAKWCIQNAQRIIEIENDMQHIGGLRGFFVELSKVSPFDLLKLAPSIIRELKFKGIGKTTVFHLMKNVGLDVFKPDIHVRRILNKLGLIDSENACVMEIFGAMKFLSFASGIRINELDTLLFVYGKNTGDKLNS